MLVGCNPIRWLRAFCPQLSPSVSARLEWARVQPRCKLPFTEALAGGLRGFHELRLPSGAKAPTRHSDIGTAEAVPFQNSRLGTAEAVAFQNSHLGRAEAVAFQNSRLGTAEAVAFPITSLSYSIRKPIYDGRVLAIATPAG